MSDDSLLLAASSAVREETPFVFSIRKKPSRAYSDVLDRARNYINAESSTLKKSGSTKASQGTLEGNCWKEMKRPSSFSQAAVGRPARKKDVATQVWAQG